MELFARYTEPGTRNTESGTRTMELFTIKDYEENEFTGVYSIAAREQGRNLPRSIGSWLTIA